MTTSHSTFIYILLLLFSLPLRIITSSARTEAEALIKWKSTNLSSTSLLDSWSISNLENLCNWTFIACNADGTISEINLSNATLSGSLDHLNFTSFPRLTSFILNGNNFSGSIPSNIGNASSLEVVVLFNNSFQGKIPSSIGKLRNLQTLDLRKNRLNSTIPSELGLCTNLTHLALAENSLQGTLPISLSSLIKLSQLALSDNFLSGEVSSDLITNWTELIALQLQNNYLTGSIPYQIGNLQNLLYLDLSRNNLRGAIPQCVLMISYNNLSGDIPSSICNLTSLRTLDLGENNFKGEILQCFGNMSDHLEVLDMHHNKFVGDLPTTFGIGCSLRSINFHGNELEGGIPRFLANCQRLQVVDLGDNHFNDIFPVWLGNLSELKVLSLRSNKFHGLIRTSRIENMFPELRIIDLSYNAFSGNLPTSMFQQLKAMMRVDQTMKFSGEIPQQLASLTSLEFLNLSYNYLQGCIPQGPQFSTFQNNSYEGNVGLHGFPISDGCGNDRVSETNYTVSSLEDQESNSEFLNDFWKAALMGYGSGLCIGMSIIYFMISTGNPRWLARIIEQLEHKFIMRMRKKQRSQRNYRRRNNRF
ncbi:hypothetical protein MTR67_016220 [Solanum verrucosum]|uniref:Leucine-rich repeat-containing N-terminal plant-type domain-containing protein n=1 Tax=Solanum verrucosum TaxID=315347 RepID=A0AAF0QIB6_SOLVR|nr:hypothetical protein MTR67_016220 [Solanum verrucosum]